MLLNLIHCIFTIHLFIHFTQKLLFTFFRLSCAMNKCVMNAVKLKTLIFHEGYKKHYLFLRAENVKIGITNF